MSSRKMIYGDLILVIVFALSGCGGSAGSGAENSVVENLADTMELQDVMGAGLKISGFVDAPSSWSSEEISPMEMIEVVFENAGGDETVYSGVPIIVLLGLAGVQDSATQITFKSTTGTETSVLLKELNACINCIVAPKEEGRFDILLPGLTPSIKIEGVFELVLN